jgi:CHAT domain-containing protein
MGTVAALGPGTVLLQYIVLEDGLRILLTTADVQKPYRLSAGEGEINPLTCRLLEALRSPSLDPRPLAKALYDLLIAPVAEDLKQAHAKTLMVSLDGVLRYVPLAALYDGRQYLAERYAVAVYIEPAADRLKDSPKAAWKVAGFGVTQALRDFPALPGARSEIEGIVKGQGHSGGVLEGTLHLDQDFTQEELRRALSPRYPVVHVASHFRFSPTEADSFLLLGDGSTLSLREIRTGRYDFQNVDLLTLSACETAVGSGQGTEVEGLAVTAERRRQARAPDPLARGGPDHRGLDAAHVRAAHGRALEQGRGAAPCPGRAAAGQAERGGA